LFDGAEELDFVGPWEVFTMLGQLQAGSCQAYFVSERGGEVKCAKGMRVLSDYSFETCPQADIIVIPGGRGTRIEAKNPAMLAFMRRMDAASEVTTSVCTGSFVLEAAGILTGKRATTHWGSIAPMKALGTVTVVEGTRFVDEGRVITASGVSAGIDMALHLVGRLWGPPLARMVQKAMEYFPDPPYGDVPIPRPG
jgi:transcriptional regulator GlxA family with amidase domain